MSSDESENYGYCLRCGGIGSVSLDGELLDPIAPESADICSLCKGSGHSQAASSDRR